MNWIKENWFKITLLILVILILIVQFQTCNKESVKPIMVFNDSTENALRKEIIDLKIEATKIESKKEIIQNKYYYETKNFLNLDSADKHKFIMEYARELLSE